MKTTIEKLDGNLYTIIWYDRFDYVYERDDMQLLHDGSFAVLNLACTHIATALPAISKILTSNDLWLIDLYKKNDIYVFGLTSEYDRDYECDRQFWWDWEQSLPEYGITEIEGAKTKTGEHIEIAIKQD